MLAARHRSCGAVLELAMHHPLNRRNFLRAAAAAAMAARLPAQMSLPTRLARDPLRPQFHLLPAKNWMNDPNGPIYFNRQYHMFFQYNPLAATWGDMSWNHAVSEDMLHWSHLPVALTPTPGGPDSFGCFSGSAFRRGQRVYQVYTGTRKSDDAHATIRDGANDIQESQCLAYSDDPRLVHWTKLKQPVIAAPPEGMAITGFRDPSLFELNDSVYITVGSGEAKVGGCVLLYRATSDDLTQWEYLHQLTSGAWNGHPTANPCDDGEMWECPDFFPLGRAHVLIYSTLDKVFWQTGEFDPVALKFTPQQSGELDLGGAFYAPKTQLDAHGRRVLWGWVREHRSDAAMTAAGWSGMMSLPRVLTLGPDGGLRVTSLPETETLRGARLPVTAAACTLPAANGEVLMTGKSGKDFVLSFGENGSLAKVEYVAASHALRVDGKEVALVKGEPPTVHGYVDGSVVELLLGGRCGYTKRFYYDGPAPGIAVRALGDGVKLEAWAVTPISDNRLTTAA
jgi:beta-fructofuranosidase